MLLGLFSSCSEQGPLFIAVACLIAEHRRKGMQASVVVVHGINSCSLQALEHRLSSCGPGPSCSMAHGILLDQGSVSCIGRQILYHESPGKTFFSFLTFSLTPPFSGPSSKHYMDIQKTFYKILIVHMAFLASVSVPLLE